MMIIRPGRAIVLPGMGVQIGGGRAFGGGFVGVLDGIGNVAAAYSLRKLRSAYAGSAVRVRRSSDSTEQDIGFDGSGEFDSAAFSTFVGGGTGYVRTWYDQSGNGRDAAQATTTKQPSVSLSAINSKPALSFDGTNDFLATGAFNSDLQEPISFISIQKFLDTNVRYIYDGITVSKRHVVAHYPNLNYDMFVTIDTNTRSFTLNTFNVFTAIFNAAASKGYALGGSPAIINPGSNSMSGLTIAARHDGVASFFYGPIVELIVCAAAVSATDHNTIGNDMATRFGLTWSTVS